MHWQEGEIESGKDDPEGDLAEALVDHPPGHFGKPNVQRAENREEIDPDQHVMDVGEDKIGVSQLQVRRHRGGHDARYAADHEHDDEGRIIEKGAGEHGSP